MKPHRLVQVMIEPAEVIQSLYEKQRQQKEKLMNSLKYLSSIVFLLSANPSYLSYTRPYENNHLLVFRQWIYSRPTLLSKFDVVFFCNDHPYYNRFKKRLLRSSVCVELTFVFMISLFCRLTGDESNKQVYDSKGR